MSMTKLEKTMLLAKMVEAFMAIVNARTHETQLVELLGAIPWEEFDANEMEMLRSPFREMEPTLHRCVPLDILFGRTKATEEEWPDIIN